MGLSIAMHGAPSLHKLREPGVERELRIMGRQPVTTSTFIQFC